jgi:hypothetical protein
MVLALSCLEEELLVDAVGWLGCCGWLQVNWKVSSGELWVVGSVCMMRMHALEHFNVVLEGCRMGERT